MAIASHTAEISTIYQVSLLDIRQTNAQRYLFSNPFAAAKFVADIPRFRIAGVLLEGCCYRFVQLVFLANSKLRTKGN